MSRDKAHLTDILKAAQAIRRFSRLVGQSCRFAVMLLAASEAMRPARLPKLCYAGLGQSIGGAAAPPYPWKLVTAMRNILIHDYDDVDLGVVWRTAQNDLPALIARLEAYLSALPPEPADTAKPTPLD